MILASNKKELVHNVGSVITNHGLANQLSEKFICTDGYF